MEDSNSDSSFLKSEAMEKKVPMTDEERLKLAAKLDNELDEFIAGLEKRSYTEGWPEDRWQEEMEKHPFFMSKAPEPGEALPPLLQGLQDLKFDESENTPEELAITYKEDGNFNFKCKNYRMAIMGYTEGIKQKSSDAEINAQLYNNRSACHFFLKNYRSSLNDCNIALQLKPNYGKTLTRAAQCCFHLKQYDKCLEYCNKVLAVEPSNPVILKLKPLIGPLKVKAARDTRRLDYLEEKSRQKDEQLINTIRNRGIRFYGHESDEIDGTILKPNFTELLNKRVYLDNDRLVWPVIFLYPEYKTSDFIGEFHEDSRFVDHLEEMFEETPPWDLDKKYKPQNISIYFEDENERIHRVAKSSTLGDIMVNKDFRVDHGTPSFLLLVRNSKSEKEFLSNYK